ncbi:hypothetical protein BaRGS_00027142, partial [Batillaria attramentaria]
MKEGAAAGCMLFCNITCHRDMHVDSLKGNISQQIIQLLTITGFRLSGSAVTALVLPDSSESGRDTINGHDSLDFRKRYFTGRRQDDRQLE